MTNAKWITKLVQMGTAYANSEINVERLAEIALGMYPAACAHRAATSVVHLKGVCGVCTAADDFEAILRKQVNNPASEGRLDRCPPWSDIQALEEDLSAARKDRDKAESANRSLTRRVKDLQDERDFMVRTIGRNRECIKNRQKELDADKVTISRLESDAQREAYQEQAANYTDGHPKHRMQWPYRGPRVGGLGVGARSQKKGEFLWPCPNYLQQCESAMASAAAFIDEHYTQCWPGYEHCNCCCPCHKDSR